MFRKTFLQSTMSLLFICSKLEVEFKVVMGPGQKFLTRASSIFCGSGWVSHLWFGFEFTKSHKLKGTLLLAKKFC